MSLTAVYLDFQDPASYRVWRWLELLPHRAAVEVRPYSLDEDEGERRNPWDRSSRSAGLELLALGEYARERGDECYRKFVEAAFRAVHEQDEDFANPEAWLALCAEVGLELQAFTEDGERWRAEVGLWQQEAEDEHEVQGVPALVFDDGRTLQVTLGEPLRDVSAACRLLADLSDLALQPIVEVRRAG